MRIWTTQRRTDPPVHHLENTPAAEFELSENANDYTRRFYAAMNDDFGTVEAVAVLFELAGEVNKTNDAPRRLPKSFGRHHRPVATRSD